MQLSAMNASMRFGALHKVTVQWADEKKWNTPNGSFRRMGAQLCTSVIPKILSATEKPEAFESTPLPSDLAVTYFSPTLLATAGASAVFILSPDKDDPIVALKLQHFFQHTSPPNYRYQYQKLPDIVVSSKPFTNSTLQNLVVLNSAEMNAAVAADIRDRHLKTLQTVSH